VDSVRAAEGVRAGQLTAVQLYGCGELDRPRGCREPPALTGAAAAAWPRSWCCGGSGQGYGVRMPQRLLTERLVLRPWQVGDAAAALGAYGDDRVARWLAPAMDQVHDPAAMRLVLQQWVAEDERLSAPAGRWAIELRGEGRLIGGATLLPLPPDEEFEVGWQLHPEAWGHGYATEAGLALARWAFEQGIEQVVAVVRPANKRAVAVAHRIGMEWVGETEKYHHLTLQVFRLRPGDLATPT
jgi:[ribosomal protein S5]-alanine N-acetyltransferase